MITGDLVDMVDGVDKNILCVVVSPLTIIIYVSCCLTILFMKFLMNFEQMSIAYVNRHQQTETPATIHECLGHYKNEGDELLYHIDTEDET